MEEKYRLMTEQIRLTNPDKDVEGYIAWIITSEAAKQYWVARTDSKCSIHRCEKICPQCNNDTFPM